MDILVDEALVPTIEKHGYGMTASWILSNHPYVTESPPAGLG
jgi:hypothetical protein